MAAVPFTERFRMYGMKDIATCLAYMPARMGFSDSIPSLVIGDDGGDVFVLNFLKHSQALFKKTEVDEVEQIYWRVRNERRLNYFPHLKCVVLVN